MQEALVVQCETHIPAPPAAVFAFLTDLDKILRWMGTGAQLEPQPSGLYLVNVTGARFARGSFREVVPVHRLATVLAGTASEVAPPASSLVEIDLIEQPPQMRRYREPEAVTRCQCCRAGPGSCPAATSASRPR